MRHRAFRRAFAVTFLLVTAVLAVRTPSIWHTHDGGDVPHEHSRGTHVHATGHAHVHSHPEAGGHKQSRHDHHGHGHHGHVHDGHVHHDQADQHTDVPTTEGATTSSWHMHFSILGMEFTVAWSSSPSTPNAAPRAEVRKPPHLVHPLRPIVGPAFGLPPERASQLVGEFQPAPVPDRVKAVSAAPAHRRVDASISRAGRDRQRPPIPPPRSHAA